MQESPSSTQIFSSSILQPTLGQLRAAAHLYGMDTPAVTTSRILGIGIGHNPLLASCARLYPGAEILDLAVGHTHFNPSLSAIPNNYQFLSTSLDQITRDLGTFDYILCPDLAAYLSADIGSELLFRCKAILAPNGLACIGHPVYPGSKVLEVVRDALLLHLRDQQHSSAEDQKAQALTALSLFHDGAAATGYFGPSLKDAADYFQQKIEQGYLDIIVSSPNTLGQYLIEFVQTAQQLGLTCIGDGHPHLDMARTWGTAVYTSNSLLTLGQTNIIRQQYLDFSTTRLWRHTLLTHEGRNICVAATPDLDKLSDLRWAGCWEPQDWAPAYIGQIYQNNQGWQQNVQDKKSAQILDMLAIRWPSSLSIRDLQLLCQISAEEVISVISRQFESGLLNYCLDDPINGAPSHHDGITILPELLSAMPDASGSTESSQITQFKTKISDVWGNPVNLDLTYREFLVLSKNSHAFSDQNLQTSPSEHHSLDISDRILSEPGIAYQLIRKLNKFALLICNDNKWEHLLDKILSNRDGIDPSWIMYILYSYIKNNICENTQDSESVAITPQQKNQLDKLSQVFSTDNYVQAEVLAKQIIKILPEHTKPVTILVRSLAYQGKYDEALSIVNELRHGLSFDSDLHVAMAIVIALRGGDIEALRIARPLLYKNSTPHYLYIALGLACRHSLRIESAEKFFTEGLKKNQDSTALSINLASLHSQQGRAQEGMDLCREIIKNKNLGKKARSIAYNNLLFMANYAVDLSAENIFKIYKDFEKDIYFDLYKNHKKHLNNKRSNRKIKIGYVSGDFREHAVSKFIEPIYNNLDRDQFLICSYSNASKEDAKTENYKLLSDRWINIYGMSDALAAEKIRNDEIDILVDLSGHTGENRLGIFALKPAPVSVSWLGFGYTTGLSAIDYYLANNVICPPGSETIFAEKPWRLDGTWAVYKPVIPDHFLNFNKEPDYQATNKIISFISLSRVIRMNSRVMQCWAKILNKIPESRLILNSSDFQNQKVCENIRSKFFEYGITADRLFMGFGTPPWTSLQKADIGLDCFPHNSGTTLFDMLYMGVPFITLADRPSVGRLGASILTSICHPEWIAHTEDEYIEKVVLLAEKITTDKFFDKQKLAEETNSSELADTKGFSEKLGFAYKEMFSIWAKK